MLQAYVRDAGIAGDAVAAAALHARVSALAKWTAEQDPQRQSDAGAVLEAAARYPLTDLASGIGFEAAGFEEMVLHRRAAMVTCPGRNVSGSPVNA